MERLLERDVCNTNLKAQGGGLGAAFIRQEAFISGHSNSQGVIITPLVWLI